jgi:hypothetical protein
MAPTQAPRTQQSSALYQKNVQAAANAAKKATKKVLKKKKKNMQVCKDDVPTNIYSTQVCQATLHLSLMSLTFTPASSLSPYAYIKQLLGQVRNPLRDIRGAPGAF